MKIVIPEPLPSLNKGEAAIFEGIWEALKGFDDVDLTVYSTSSWITDDKRNYGSKCAVVDGVDLFDLENKFLDIPLTRSRMHFFRTWGKIVLFAMIYRISKSIANVIFNDRLLESISDADLILAGHDGMLGYEHFWLVLASQIMNKPIALFGGGNDGTKRMKLRIRKFLQYAIKKSIICTVRDKGTKNFLVLNDVSPEKVFIYPDPAFLFKPCSTKRAYEILKNEGIPTSSNIPLYGLIPVRGGIVFEKSFEIENNIEQKHKLRIEFWIKIISYLLKETNAHFVFLPHCIGPTDKNDDRRAARDIYNSMLNFNNRISLIENEYSVDELKGMMSTCDFVLGERTHGLIGSISMAIPCIALTVKEDSRMHNIVSEMGKRKTFNLNNPNIEDLKKILLTEWKKREDIAKIMSAEAIKIHKEAYRAASHLKQAFKEKIKL